MGENNLSCIELNIDRMTCANCQNRIQTALIKLDGIVKAEVSFSSGTASVVFDKTVITTEKIIDCVNALGYNAVVGTRNKNISRAIVFSLIILIIYAVLQHFGLLNYLIPSQLADNDMGYGMLFFTGLITSVHCIAMCGGINLSQSLPSVQEKDEDRNNKIFILPSLLYNLGRVISYTAVGFILGLLGMLISGNSETGLSYLVQGLLKIFAGVLMVIMGINMLGIFPKMRKIKVRFPAFISRNLNKATKRSKTPLLVGLLNGLMPCGALQSVQIIALASGSPFVGALSMLMFSLGTIPLMLALGSIVSALGKRFTGLVMTLGAVLVAVLGLAMLSQGISLSGVFDSELLFVCAVMFFVIGTVNCIQFKKISTSRIITGALIFCTVVGIILLTMSSSTAVKEDNSENISNEIIDGKQVVYSTLSSGQYSDIYVKVGIPVKWIIDATEDSMNGCNYKMLIEEFGLEYTFHTGENVIEFTPNNVGNFSYSCWMGMIQGHITVTE